MTSSTAGKSGTITGAKEDAYIASVILKTLKLPNRESVPIISYLHSRCVVDQVYSNRFILELVQKLQLWYIGLQ